MDWTESSAPFIADSWVPWARCGGKLDSKIESLTGSVEASDQFCAMKPS